MDPKLVEFAKDWIKIAEGDLSWARASFNEGFYSRVCFVCQQVAEKSLKGFLYAFNKTEKTHSLIKLMSLCLKSDPEFTSLKNNLLVLDPYYIGTRYPDLGEVEKFNKKDLAQEAIQSAEEVLEFVKGKIG